MSRYSFVVLCVPCAFFLVILETLFSERGKGRAFMLWKPGSRFSLVEDLGSGNRNFEIN